MDILAPSNNASCPAVGGGYLTTFGGTSAASPYSAGAAALVLHAAMDNGITLSSPDLRAMLIATGDPILDDKSGITKPRVNVGNAVDSFGTWVDFAYIGTETGSSSQPFNTLAEGIAAVPSGGALLVRAGTSSETPTISKPLTINAEGGAVTVGG